MAETAIISVLSKFGELASREAAVLLRVGDDIVLLRDRLEWLQAFVRDADRKRRLGIDDLTRVWVRQTRDAAFEVEDTLEHFFHKVDLDGHRGWKAWHRYFTGWIIQITVRRGLSARIQKIKDRLDQISDNRKEYKIEHIPSGRWTSSFTEFAPWYNFKRKNIVKYLVGFEGYLNTLKSQLLDAEGFPHRGLVSILGESGTGKYTLMKEIYDHVNHHFKVLIWYYMPPNSSVEDLLKEVHVRALENMGPQEQTEYANSDQEEDIDIAGKLRRLLDKKRYMLVLGGVQSKTILNCFGASLPDNKIGSRVVLMEPENEDIAKHAETMNEAWKAKEKSWTSIIQLRRLDEEESGELFRLRVFGGVAESMEAKRQPKNRRNVQDYHLKAKTREKTVRFLSFLPRQGETANQDKNNEQDEETAKQEKSYDQDVFDITGGNPLAIVVLAGLLRSKEKPVEWDMMLEQLRHAEEAQGNNDNRISGALLSREQMVDRGNMLLQQWHPASKARLSNRMCIERIFSTSFDDLPHDLKSCFLYFATFPKNLCHPADRIVRMWMAEGFIKPRKDKTMEEVGRDYLEELASRCLVEVEEINDQGEIEVVRVHNRLLVFLQSEAREASFVEVHDTNDILAPASVRRLSMQHDCGNDTTCNSRFPKLRSFIYYGDEMTHTGRSSVGMNNNNSGHNSHKFPNLGSKLRRMMAYGLRDRGSSSISDNVKSILDLKFLGRSKFLRVISIQGMCTPDLPEEIGEMTHLRYLRVTCSSLNNLPSTIGRLLNLQTLDIRKTKIEQVHPKFWKLKSLRHVLAEDLMLPNSMIRARELQTLHGVKPKPSRKEWVVGGCPLDLLKELRSLELHGFLANKHNQALGSALGKMHFLKQLKLTGDAIPPCVFTAPSLRCLHTLVLCGRVQRNNIPSDIRTLRPNLVVLRPKLLVLGPNLLHEAVDNNDTVPDEESNAEVDDIFFDANANELEDTGMLSPNNVFEASSDSEAIISDSDTDEETPKSFNKRSLRVGDRYRKIHKRQKRVEKKIIESENGNGEHILN